MSALIPLELDDGPAGARVRRWLAVMLAVGVAARVVRYILRFPLWEDECFLVYNLIGRGYAELTGPLDYQQVAPPAFVWMLKALTQGLGFSELPLRLPAFAASLLSLGLFAHMARRLLRGWALVLAVGLFAAAYPAIRYAAEAKPYGVDLAVSLVIVALAVEWLRDGRARWLWALAAFMGPAALVSYPAVFVGGAASVVVLGAVRRSGQWAAWGAFNGVMLGAFAVTLWLAGAAHGEVTVFMTEAWRSGFAPVGEPWLLPGWVLKTLTGDAMAFPAGSGNGGSSLTFILCAVGLVALWRSGRRAWVAALLGPLALHLAASAMQRYPLGGHVKFSMHLMPMICLAAGVGGAAIVEKLCAPGVRRRVAMAAACAALLLVGLGSVVRDVAAPWKTYSDERVRGLARWLWFDLPHGGEVACLKRDLEIDFSPATFGELSWSAMYLVNQHIASPRHRAGRPPALDKVAAGWPLYVVEFRDGGKPYDHAAQQRWLERMQERYRLDARQALPMTRYDKRERRLIATDHVQVYRFVPR